MKMRTKLFWVILLIIVMVFPLAACSGDGNDDDDDKDTSELGVSKTVNQIQVKFTDVKTNTAGNILAAPESGNVFVGVKFEVKNTSSADVACSSLLCFSATYNGATVDYEVFAISIFGESIDGTIASGATLTGWYVVELPSAWDEFAIQFKPNLSSSSVSFAVKSSYVSGSIGDNNNDGDTEAAGLDETKTINQIEVKFTEVKIDTEGNILVQPESGNVFVGVKFDVKNTSSKNFVCSSALYFSAAYNNSALEYEVYAITLFGDASIDSVGGGIAPGATLTGWYAVELPSDWDEFTIKFKPDLTSSSNVSFKIKSSDVTGGSNNETVELSASMFDGYMVDLSGVASMGVVNDGKNKIMAYYADDQAEEIVFKKVSGGSNDTITQNDFDAAIRKLYVTDKYIYFNISTSWASNDLADYQKYYASDTWSSMSFLIDRRDGHIYGLEKYGFINEIKGHLINVDDVWYALSVNDNEVVDTKLIPNDDIPVSQVDVSKDGTVFIENHLFTRWDDANNVYFYKAETSCVYIVGSDGKFYKFNQNCNSIQVFDIVTKQWSAPVVEVGKPIELNGGPYIKLLICNFGAQKKLYRYGNSTDGLAFRIYDYRTEGAFLVYEITLDPAMLIVDVNYFLINGNLYYVYRGEMFVCKLDTYENSQAPIRKRTGVSINKALDDGVVVLQITWEGTIKYKVFVDEFGNVDYEEYESVTDDAILIFPLQ